jgi:methionyl-tRNA synthetase
MWMLSIKASTTTVLRLLMSTCAGMMPSFTEKVWRELDLREKMNQTFRYDSTDDDGSQLFINMLLKAVNSVVRSQPSRMSVLPRPCNLS